MRVAVDTNVLVYAEGIGDQQRVERAIYVIDKLENQIIVPMQVIGELFNVLSKKANYDRRQIIEVLADWGKMGKSAIAQLTTMPDAIHLSLDHNLQIWDAVILQTAVDAGCEILLSEDMQHGFYRSGLTIINPFKDAEHPLLSDALARLS